MMGEFKMPSLGADMTAGTLLEWRVKPGEEVKRGDIVAVVDTSKAEIEVEIFETGVIDELLVGEGEKVPVGTVLATVKAAGETAPTSATEPTAPTEPTEPALTTEPTAPTEPTEPALTTEPAAATEPTEPALTTEPAAATEPTLTTEPPARLAPPSDIHDGRHRASPLAARIAKELRVDLTDVHGTGPGGAIVREDVERAAQTRGHATEAARGALTEHPPDTVVGEVSGTVAPHTPSGEASGPVVPDTAVGEVSGTVAAASSELRHAQPLSKQAAMRQAIGSLMARSKREIPHYYLQREIDATAATDWLADHNRQLPPARRLLPAALLLAAVSHSAIEMPEMNGLWGQSGFEASDAVHLGVAISLRGGGLVAPAIRDAQELSLHQLMSALRDLVSRARAGTLRSSEMSSPTITVTNLGEQGADLVHGVIYPPQVALVGFGSIRERPWASGGMLAARPTVIVTLAADHRASDGHEGSRFLAAIERRLHQPESLLDAAFRPRRDAPASAVEPEQPK